MKGSIVIAIGDYNLRLLDEETDEALLKDLNAGYPLNNLGALEWAIKRLQRWIDCGPRRSMDQPFTVPNGEGNDDDTR